MGDFGVDYSFSRPDIQAMARDGVKFAVRYFGTTSSGKNATKGECDSLRAAGIDVITNYESSAGFMVNGYNEGVSCAQKANNNAKDCGAPASAPIIFSLDVDPRGLSSSQWAGVYQFTDGAASIIGRARTWVYGGYDAMLRLFNDGKIGGGWQTYAWSEGRWDTRAALQQYQNGINRWGGQVDYNRSIFSPYGAWGQLAEGDWFDMATREELRAEVDRSIEAHFKVGAAGYNIPYGYTNLVTMFEVLVGLSRDQWTRWTQTLPQLLDQTAQEIIDAMESSGATGYDPEQIKQIVMDAITEWVQMFASKVAAAPMGVVISEARTDAGG